MSSFPSEHNIEWTYHERSIKQLVVNVDEINSSAKKRSASGTISILSYWLLFFMSQ